MRWSGTHDWNRGSFQSSVGLPLMGLTVIKKAQSAKYRLNFDVLIGHTESSANSLSSLLKSLCSWTRHHHLSPFLVGFLLFPCFLIGIYIFYTFKSFLKPCRLAPSPPHPPRPFHVTLWFLGVCLLGSYFGLPWSRNGGSHRSAAKPRGCFQNISRLTPLLLVCSRFLEIDSTG